MTPLDPNLPEPAPTPADTPTIGPACELPPTLATPGPAELTPTLIARGDGVPGPQGTPRAPAPAPPPPSGLAGYEVMEEIAHGGMGIVFKARQLGLDRLVALKVMIAGEHASPEALERFQREARAAAKLQHPHIVQIYDVGRDGAKHFFTMRYVEGPSLAERIERKEVTPRRALEIARKVALALDYAHAHGVIHRDVKPANILVDAQGEPHLADFGLAKDLAADGVTAPGSSLGTPNYAAPEQAAGDTHRIDARSDVYALGATLYHALTGRPPFSGESVFAILSDVLATEPDPPRKVNPRIQRDIETICLKAMEKRPERRYQTAREMADDIGRYLDGEPIHARAVSWAERQWRRAVKNRGVVVPMAVAVAVATSFLAWLGWTSWRTSRRVTEEVDSAARWEREADLAASRDDRRAILARTRDALVGVLRLDEGNRAAKEALGRVTGRLDAIAREEEVERVSASQRAAAAEEALRKSQLVSKVFARWSRLAAAVGELESIAYDDRLPDDAKVARARAAWWPIERFVAETPEDAASRATAAALGAWAERYLGDNQGPVMKMKEAAKADPDLPYGRLMEALDIFSQLVELSPLPSLVIGPTGVEVGETRGAPENMDVAVKHLSGLLSEARTARVWGKEGAEDFNACMEGILALQAGEWARADERFSRALTAPDLAAFGSGLLLGRANARYMAKRFQPALDDLALLAKARPAWATAPFRQAQVIYALSLDEAARGVDARERVRASIARFDAAIALSDRNLELYANRGVAWQVLGKLEAARGVDPLPSIQKAIADFEETLRRDPDHVNSYVNLGALWGQVGEVQAARGEDPGASFERAMEAYARALTLRPDLAEIRVNRGTLVQARANWVEGRGGDSRELLAESIREYGEALRTRPELASAFNNRGTAWSDLGKAEAERGEDPTESYGKAMTDFARATAVVPRYVEAWTNLGQTGTNLGEWLLQARKDPTAVLTKAIADLETAASINPSFFGAWSLRGYARKLLGQWEDSQGRDPRPEFDKAREALDEALRLNPASENATNHRALVWLSRAEWEARSGIDPRPSLEEAIADTGRTVELNPASLQAHCNRGSCWARMAEVEKNLGLDAAASIEKAFADYKAALAVNPRAWQAHQCLGAVFELAGDDEKALECYERAHEIVGEAYPPLNEAIQRLKKGR